MSWLQLELDDYPQAELYVIDFIDDHPSNDDVGLDNEVVNDGELHVNNGDRVVNDGDGDVHDDDGPEGDGDDQQVVPKDHEEILGDDEEHEAVPMVRRIRKPSDRITLTKLKKSVYDKDGDVSSSANPITLE
ncbi:unnamed protein product [Lactuca virosa]|uniref:Uncharacterized protein n=1 Tax=Lactuca virosa TaxID=75947 RepID=A0AAU9NFZ3_9ASTR|nr:unnamed protein product [Lactuca virosa]